MISPQLKISAIICTHNRSDLLPKAIDSLLKQTLNCSLYEIIVIDNASTDNTKQVCDEFSAEPHFRYIFEQTPGLSLARNRGLKEALGEYVAYIDDDAIASDAWLERILEAFETVLPHPVSVGGIINPIWECQKPTWLTPDKLPFLTVLNYGSQPHFIEYPKILYGTNMAFSRRILLEIGGFRTDVGRVKNSLLSCEESDIYKKFSEKNHPVYYIPSASVEHLVDKKRVTKSWFYRRQYWQGRSEALLLPEAIPVLALLTDIRASVANILTYAGYFLISINNEQRRFTAVSSIGVNIGRIHQLALKLSSCGPNTSLETELIPTSYDLSSPISWVPNGSVTINLDTPKQPELTKEIRVVGTGETNSWSILRTKQLKLYPGQKYRLSAQMCINKISNGSSFFKCELYHNGRWIKNIDSVKYDVSRAGEWQDLHCNITTPKGITVATILTVEKRPYDEAVFADILLRNVNLELI